MPYVLLKYSFGSLLYGGLITFAILLLIYLIIKGWRRDAIFTPPSYVVAVIGGGIVLISSTIAFGALSIQSELTSLQSLADNAKDLQPIIDKYASGAAISATSAAEYSTALIESLRSYLDGLIMKCLLWIAGAVIIGTIAVIKTLGTAGTLRGAYRRRSEPSRPMRNTGRRISRRN